MLNASPSGKGDFGSLPLRSLAQSCVVQQGSVEHTGGIMLSPQTLADGVGPAILFLSPTIPFGNGSDLLYMAALATGESNKSSSQALLKLSNEILERSGPNNDPDTLGDRESRFSQEKIENQAWTWCNKVTTDMPFNVGHFSASTVVHKLILLQRDRLSNNMTRYMSVLKTNFEASLPVDSTLKVKIVNHEDMHALVTGQSEDNLTVKTLRPDQNVMLVRTVHSDPKKPGSQLGTAAVLFTVDDDSATEGLNVRTLLAEPWDIESMGSVSHRHRMAFCQGTKVNQDMKEACTTAIQSLVPTGLGRVRTSYGSLEGVTGISPETGAQGPADETSSLIPTSGPSLASAVTPDLNDAVIDIPTTSVHLASGQVTSAVTSALELFLKASVGKGQKLPRVYGLDQDEFDQVVASGVFAIP